jgi:hypothetical protein
VGFKDVANYMMFCWCECGKACKLEVIVAPIVVDTKKMEGCCARVEEEVRNLV